MTRKPEYCGHCGAAISRRASYLTSFGNWYGTVAAFYAWFIFNVGVFAAIEKPPAITLLVTAVPSILIGLMVWHWDKIRRRHFLGATWKEDWK